MKGSQSKTDIKKRFRHRILKLRHLELDRNPLLPEDIYPVAESTEEAVEAYCQAVFENNSVLENVFPNL